MPLDIQTLNQWREAVRTQAWAKRWGKTRKCGPAHTAWGEMCDWDLCGQVHASKKTLSRASCCSGRGHAQVGSHSNAIGHACRCIAVRQPELLQTGSHRWIDPQQGHLLQWEGTHACGHAQQCKLCTQPVPGGRAFPRSQ